MLDLSAFAKRSAEAAQDLAEAVSLGAPPTPQGVPGAPPGPQGSPAPLPRPSAPVGPLQGSPQSPLAVKPTPASPLEMMPAFKSPTFASMLQGEVGRQGPVGFALGGRVQRNLAVGGPVDFDFSCR